MHRPICLVRRAVDLPGGLDWLGPTERAHLATLRVAKRRSEWLLGRWTAKQTLLSTPQAPLQGPDLADLEIRPSPEGMPRIFLRGESLPIAISLSHRAGAAFCTIGMTGSVGCDLEWIEDRSRAFIEDYFTPSEQDLIDAGGRSTRALMANGLWSAKESVLKILGTGLRVDTRSLTVEVPGRPCAEEWQPFAVDYKTESRQFKGWWRRMENWVLTVVTDPSGQCPLLVTNREGEGKVPAS